MGGHSSQRNVQDSTTNQHAFNAGSTPYQGDIFPAAHNLMQMSQQWGPFHGDQVAAPGQAQQVAQHGAGPSTFVVAPHQQGTIDAGVAAAQGTAGAQQPAINQTYSNINQILSSPRNSFLQGQEDALGTLNSSNLARQTSDLMQNFGSTGGVGSGNLAKATAFNNQANSDSFNNTIAGLEANNYQNWQAFNSNVPNLLQGLNAATQAPIQSQGQWTDQQQENAQASATNEYDQWLAQYQQASDQANQTNANTAFGQQTQQAGLDNAYLDWLRQNEWANNQASLYGQIGNLYTGSGDQTQTGQEHSTSTTTESHPAWQDIAGLLGAGMQGFGQGGMFSGSLKALGGAAGAAGAAGGISSATASILPFIFSDRRLKKNIEPIGNGWYQFDYLWDPPGTNRIGVMADEIDPKFVHADESGYLLVDYGALLGVA